ncbi:MAG: efflux RND transporter periplasmic adaptor subunit [Bryobacterales bacterium]|nr:efflux RND transporter periplasmic adaptor subunit [Bryobacterales bacterium]
MSIKILLPLTALAVLAGCSHSEPKKPGGPGVPAVAVRTVAVESASWPETYDAIGTVRPRKASVISSKLMGYVREVRVNAGDRVREGQVLLTVDARDLEVNRQRAEAGRQEASSAAIEVDNAIAAAKANLELAQVTYSRFQDLYQKKSVSNQEFDEAATRLKAARASYEMALAKKKQVNARIEQAEREIQAVAINLGYAEIKAPFAGMVTEKSVDPGNLAAPGVPLLTIEQAGSYRLEASLEESRLPLARLGQSVPVTFDALARTVTGRVAEIVPAVDAASRSFIVKVDLPGVQELRSGLFGRASFAVAARQVTALPPSAVIERGQLQYVMVADQGVARARLITLGRRSPERVEVLSGLNPGEQVIHPIPAGLEDGARVEVRS